MPTRCCLYCEFYCTVPPNVGKCNVKMADVSSEYCCSNFTQRLNRSRGTVIDTANAVSIAFYDAVSDEPIMTFCSGTRCLSCGHTIQPVSRGRRQYCGVCGCYLPKIVYGDSFTELVKDTEAVKPRIVPPTIDYPPMPIISGSKGGQYLIWMNEN